MNEQLIVRLSEIILAIMAFFGTVIVILASWRDYRIIAKQKKLNITNPPSFSADENLGFATVSIRTLPAIFTKLSQDMIMKALSWRTNDTRQSDVGMAFLSGHTTRSMFIASVGLVVYVSLLTYFFYTAAILRSNTLLTLSWMEVSLWLAAVIWSNENMSLSKKSEITFAVPFMYFIFYVLAFPLLLSYSMQTLKQAFQQLTVAIQLEMYSTRF